MNNQQNWQQQAWQQSQAQNYRQAGAPQPVYVQAQGTPAGNTTKKSGKGWIVAIIAIVSLCALIAVGMVSCSEMLSSSLGGVYGSQSSDIAYLSEDSIAIIEINGTIQYDGSNSSPEGLKYQLDRAEENNKIKAVVLRVNSGGGVATAGEEMTNYVRNFSKPIVVSSASMNASAAYELSSQADFIFTAKTTAIGSIGTAMSITDLSGLYEKLGINIEDITSAESKDSSYGNRPLTEEERQYYQDMVDEINGYFIEAVAEGRNLSIEQVRELATGLTFTGVAAVENGLADDIGTLEDAIEKAANLAGVTDYSTVYLEEESISMYDLLDILGESSTEDELLIRFKELMHNGSFAY